MAIIKRVGVMFAVLAMTACSMFANVNPVARAETVDQKALAAYGAVTIGVEQIAALLKPGTLPDSIEAKMVVLAENATAFATEGLEAYWQAQNERDAFAQDSSDAGRLNTVLNNLDNWVTRADGVISDLNKARKGEVQ